MHPGVSGTGMMLSIRESAYGLWNICHGETVLYAGLPLVPAVRLARMLAREEHARHGNRVEVAMECSEFALPLMRYGLPRSARRVAA